ncbi:MAG TPA: hypothetical protein DCS30_17590 [Rhizobiales bacterium]|nr:hypothetical protein [Hyphomicrobiales bacterium]
MQHLIEKSIVEEAKKRLARYSQRSYYAVKYQKSYTKRTGEKAKSRTTGLPKSWEFDPHFDPRHCINHSKFIAKGVWNSLLNGTYSPKTALRSEHTKPDGGVRYIDAFSIPDAAIANIFMRILRKRNAKSFSDCSYAYQEGKTPLDAVLRVKRMLKGEKIFISQYDFSKFFDNIEHDHINYMLREDGPFQTTFMERQLLQSVLKHKYSLNGKITQRDLGTPQGNSLSLFTSNVAAHFLDEELSKLSGLFVRFADDSVVVNYSYEEALKCAETYRQFSESSGVKINSTKSSGIRLLANTESEIRHINEFSFLSYKFTPDELLVSDKTIKTIKMRCAKTIYRHLLLHPRRANMVSAKRISGKQYDWDLVTCLNELRNYIYGGLRQTQIDDYLNGKANIRNMQGAVSYFSLVENSAQFRSLDGWLVDILHRAVSERVRFIRNVTTKKTHRLIDVDELLNGSWYQVTSAPMSRMETTVPSFFTAWRAGRKSLTRHGLGGVDTIGMGYNYE